MKQLPGEPGRHRADPTTEERLAPVAQQLDLVQTDLGPASLSQGPRRVARGPRFYNQRLRFPHIPLRQRLVASDVVALICVWAIEVVLTPPAVWAKNVACVAATIAATLLAMQQCGLYRSRVCALRSLEALKVFWSVAIGTGVFCLVRAPFVGLDMPAPLEAGAAGVVTVILLRWRYTRWLKGRRSTSRHLRTVVMLGTNEDAESLWSLFTDEPALGYKIGAVVGDHRPLAPWRSLPQFRAVDRLAEVATMVGANGVIVIASYFSPRQRKEIVDKALDAQLHVQVWPGLDDFSARRTRLAPVSDIPMFYVERRDVTKMQLATKRFVDLVLGSILGVASLPLIGLAALAIKLEDRGPVLHRSERVGLWGNTISVLKLRTMVPDASTRLVDVAALNERKDGPLFKATHDPRVTKVGKFLRSTSIDELPQLWNVITGTMSLVGPRPALVHEVERFDPELHRRHEMRPGITGLWQVEARDNPSFSAYRRLDLSYIDNWSLTLDIAIMASTVYQLVERAVSELGNIVHRKPATGLPHVEDNELVIELDN